jgi:aspartyl-tRNA(Asn)/glutamyl-tRNA(Gln) amidotransferase subunit B
VDANVSVRRPGEGLGTKTEVKNMNSFSNVERALNFEIDRQRRVVSAGGVVHQETLLWDANRGEARPMRSKEESHDYRYFPDPDLPVLEISEEWLAEIAARVPEMPWSRTTRFESSYSLSRAHADQLTASTSIADYFEAVVAAGAAAQEAASWVMGEVLAAANASATPLASFGVRPDQLAGLLRIVRSGVISRPVARQVFLEMVATGREAQAIVEEQGLTQVRDRSTLEAWVDQVLVENSDSVARFRAGEAKLMGFFVGQVMKLSGGIADPKEVAATLRSRLQ